MAVTEAKNSTERSYTFSTLLPPSAVYDYLADFERHHEWCPEIVEQRKTSTGPVGLGTTYETTEAMKAGSKMKNKTSCEIMSLERPQRIVWKAHTDASSGPLAMRSRWSFTIEPEGTGSRVTQSYSFDPPNIFARTFLKVFTPIADGLLGGLGASPKNVRRHVEELQRVLDDKATASGRNVSQ